MPVFPAWWMKCPIASLSIGDREAGFAVAIAQIGGTVTGGGEFYSHFRNDETNHEVTIGLA